MTLRFHPQAQDEFEESVAYYDAAREGLGLQFRDAVRQSLDRVTAAPEIGEARGVTRRLPVNGFPYHVVYRATLADGGAQQLLGALRALGPRAALMVGRIARHLHAIDRQHLASDRPLPVEHRQHRPNTGAMTMRRVLTIDGFGERIRLHSHARDTHAQFSRSRPVIPAAAQFKTAEPRTAGDQSS